MLWFIPLKIVEPLFINFFAVLNLILINPNLLFYNILTNNSIFSINSTEMAITFFLIACIIKSNILKYNHLFLIKENYSFDDFKKNNAI